MSTSESKSKGIVTALALVPTPLLVFVSPAIQLYLGNQEDLHYQSGVLLPFVAAALVTAALGACLWSLSRHPLFRVLTCSYLFIGPFWLAFRFLSSIALDLPFLAGLVVAWSAETIPGIALWAAIWLVVSLIVSSRVQLSLIVTPMAIFGLVLVLGDVFAFVRGAKLRQDASETGLLQAPSWEPPSATGPNVYHIVLDELQTDVFELVRTPEIDRALSGLLYFPKNHAIYHSTVMSLSSTLTSTRYVYDRSRGQYVRDGFRKSSLVGALASSGYQTLALVPESDPISADESGFHHVVHHVDNFERSASVNSTVFRNLWVVANIPAVLVEWATVQGWLSERTQAGIQQTRAGRGLTDSAPLASAMSFETLMQIERTLPDSGRYTLVHLLLPHAPYVLGKDCTYRGWEPSENPLAQTECTLELLADYLGELDSLGRFESALIVVHGDHGAPYRVRKGGLVRSRARSLATPLLIKPPGRGRSETLERCAVDASLLDMAPTLFEMLDLAPHTEFAGSSLLEPIHFCTGAP